MSTNSNNPVPTSDLNTVFETFCSGCGKKYKFKHKYLGKTIKCKICGTPVLLVKTHRQEQDLPEQSEKSSYIAGWTISIALHCLLLISLGGITLWSGLGKGSHAREVEIFIEDEGQIISDDKGLESFTLPLPDIPLPNREELTSDEVELLDSDETSEESPGIDEIIDHELLFGGEFKYEEEELDSLSSSGSHGDSATFFGVEAKGEKIVYIVDCSGSMEGERLRAAKWEIKRSILELGKQMEFFIIFYNNGPIPMEAETFASATLVNKHVYLAWVEDRTADGGTYPEQALESAYEMKPNAIFLLSDGDFNRPQNVLNVIKRYNPQYKIPINTIGYYTNNQDLRIIADETGGAYKYWNRSGINP